MGNLDFGLLDTQAGEAIVNYRTAGPQQNDNVKYLIAPDANYNTVFTVTTGKTFYITGIFFGGAAAANELRLATGAAASEVDFILCYGISFYLNIPTPIKIPSGTRISFKGDDVGRTISIFGWEE